MVWKLDSRKKKERKTTVLDIWTIVKSLSETLKKYIYLRQQRQAAMLSKDSNCATQHLNRVPVKT